MRGWHNIKRLWTVIKTWSKPEGGAAAVEYTVILAAFAIAVVASLSYLGGTLGGSFANVVINTPLAEADYGINPHECKKGGWQDLSRDDGSGFKNQGDCMQYANTGK